LTEALRTYGDPLAPVLVLGHRTVPFQIRMKIRRDGDYEASTVLTAVAAQLHRTFEFDARGFIQPVHRSEVIAAAHRTPGVVAVDLDALTRTPVLWSFQRLLANGPTVIDGAEILLLAADPLPWLSEMP